MSMLFSDYFLPSLDQDKREKTEDENREGVVKRGRHFPVLGTSD